MLQIYKKKIIYARNYCVFFLKRRQNPKKHIPFFAVATKNGGSERSAVWGQGVVAHLRSE